MPFCANCGTNITGTFCPTCGTPAGAPPNTAPGSTPPQPPPGASHNPQAGFPPPAYAQPQGQQAAGLSENAASALCYILGFVTGIIFLVLAPYNTNPRVKFHAWQSIIFNVAYFVLSIGLTVLTSVVGGMMHFMWGLILALHSLVSLVMFLFWLFLMYKAYQGENFEIPVIGGIARQQAGK